MALSPGQSINQVGRGSLAEAYLYERPDNYTHHIVNEVIGCDPEFKLTFT